MTKQQMQLLQALKDLKPRKIRQQLRRGNCYCIGGAMCEAYRQVLNKSEWWEDRVVKGGWWFRINTILHSSYTGVPEQVIVAFGITRQQMVHLIDANDNTEKCVRMRDLINMLTKYMKENEKIHAEVQI